MIEQRPALTCGPKQPGWHTACVLITLLTLLLAHTPALWAQTGTEPAAASVGQLENQLQALGDNASLSDSSRTSARDLLNRAIAEQKTATGLEDEIRQLRERISSAPELERELQAQLDKIDHLMAASFHVSRQSGFTQNE